MESRALRDCMLSCAHERKWALRLEGFADRDASDIEMQSNVWPSYPGNSIEETYKALHPPMPDLDTSSRTRAMGEHSGLHTLICSARSTDLQFVPGVISPTQFKYKIPLMSTTRTRDRYTRIRSWERNCKENTSMRVGL